uniref:Uncharacterized protein n=2 Tax=Clytia hemisphaerica TaxID=252671 RepID=A0A7M5UZ65_9CNID
MALMNTDIAAYEQLEWNRGRQRYEKLAVVKTLPIQASIIMPFMGLMLLTPNDLCLGRYKTEAENVAMKKHRRKITVTPVYKEPLGVLLTEASIFSLLLMIAGVMIGAGLLFDIARYLNSRYRKQSKSENGKEVFEDDNGEPEESNKDMVLVPKKQLAEFRDEISSLKHSLANLADRLDNQK